MKQTAPLPTLTGQNNIKTTKAMTKEDAEGILSARRLLNENQKTAVAVEAAEEIKKALENGIAAFWFEKTDGTLRHALGTRNAAIIEQWKEMNLDDDERVADLNNQRNTFRRRNASETSFFDLEARNKTTGEIQPAWRSFVSERAIGIDESYC